MLSHNNKIRDTWIDYAKSIGIILVVYGHVARGLIQANVINKDNIFFNQLDTFIYSFHMPLFFFISGITFLNSFKKTSWRNFVKNKINLIFYPYLLWSTIQGSIEVLLSKYTNGNLGYDQLLNILWEPRAQFWFLYTLIIIIILSSIFFKIIKSNPIYYFLITSIILHILGTVLPYLYNADYYMIYFSIGIIISKNIKKLDEIKTSYILITLILLYYSKQHFEYDNIITNLINTTLIILFITSLCRKYAYKNYKLFIHIGTASMVIYLLHIITGSGIRIILIKLFNTYSLTIHLPLGLFFGIFAPLLFFFFINKYNIPFVLSIPLHKKNSK